MGNSTLLLLFKWCEKHIALEGIKQRGWDREFAGDLDTQLLLDIILAANFLDIPPLLDACCRAAADQIKGKTPAEMRAHFQLQVAVTT